MEARRAWSRRSALALAGHAVLLAAPFLAQQPALAQQPDWYASDMHVHASGWVPTEVLIDDMVSSGTHVGHALVWGMGFAVDAAKYLGQQDDPASLPGHILHWDVEISQLPGFRNGHMIMLNIADPNAVTPAGVNYPGQDFLLPNYDYVQPGGGIVGYAHAQYWIPGSYALNLLLPAPHEFPLDVVLEQVDFLSTETMDAPGFFWLWYEMLDAGFHVAPSAGSDSPGDNPLGTMHTVSAHTPGTPFTFANHIDALRNSRCIIRNNSAVPDYLDLRVNGQWLGSELALAGGTVAVEIDAASVVASHVELVVDGQVVQAFPITGSVTTYPAALSICESSWIAARTVSYTPSPLPEAHTAATFVLVDGKPIRNDPGAALQWRNYLDLYYQWGVNNSIFGASQPLVQQKVAEAKLVWETIAQAGGGPSSYCTAGTSASGCQASIAVCGASSATAASGFVLSADGVEGAKDGLFFFGTSGRQANPWGSGTSYQCVAPPVSRAGLLAGGGTAGLCDGAFSQDLNSLWCPTCPKPQTNPGAGATVQAQLWYRDPFNTSNQTTSLSDAVEFSVGL